MKCVLGLKPWADLSGGGLGSRPLGMNTQLHHALSSLRIGPAPYVMFVIAKVSSNTDFGVDFAIELLQDQMSTPTHFICSSSSPKRRYLGRGFLAAPLQDIHFSLDKSQPRVLSKQVPMPLLFVKYTYCTRQCILPKKIPSPLPSAKIEGTKHSKTHQK